MDLTYANNYYGFYDNIHNFFSTNFKGLNPVHIIIFIIVIIAFIYIMQGLTTMGGSGEGIGFSNFGNVASSGSNSDMFITIIKVLMVGIVIGLIAVNGIQYFYKLDFTTKVNDILTNKPKIAINVKQHIPESKKLKPIERRKKQVFHIPGNVYTYDDAKAVCKAYGAKIATLEQIESAYDNGAEWCSYGWSDNQMAFFPTQRETWNKLQKIKGHKHDCGRPGINGGFIKNKNVKFGVNCYGYKPRMSKAERKAIETQGLYPKTMEDKYEDYKVNHYRRKLKDIIIAPFNKQSWFQL